jgi:RNA polymerase sigma-70 factor (ECF subfamily)
MTHHPSPDRDSTISETSFSLLERLRVQSDSVSWKRFVDLYGPLLLGWLRRQGVSPHDADDLVQEVLGVVVRELPAFQHNQRTGAFRAWLRTILVNRLRAFWRARRTQPVAQGGAAPDLEEMEDFRDDLTRLEDQEHDRYILRRLMELLEPEFAPTTWQAFQRVALQGQSASAAAADLGLSVNAVWLARSRVLRRLREESRGLLD